MVGNEVDNSWRPVTGCKMNCWYCYARELRTVFPVSYPDGFEPTFHPEIIDLPRHVREPKYVFVCDEADLFGAWVPDEWIERVFETVRECPQHTFRFCTKNPSRYADLDLPRNGTYGTTADTAAAVERIDTLRAAVPADLPRFVMCLPLLEAVDPDLTGIAWVEIGGAITPFGGPLLEPDPEWVMQVMSRAEEAGTAVFLTDAVYLMMAGIG